MQATTSKRFLVTLAVLLGTTVIPWLFYAKLQNQDYGLNFGLDLRGGASITYRVQATGEQDQATVLKDAIRVTQFRVDKFGVSEVNIFESGSNQFTVELPGRGKEEIDRIKNIMSKVGSLEFRIVAKPEVVSAETAKREREKEAYAPSKGFRWYPSDEGREYLLEVPDHAARADLEAARASGDAKAIADAEKQLKDVTDRYVWTGKDLESVSYGRTSIQEGGGPNDYEVYFSINPGRKSAFGDFTGENIERQMAIVLSDSVHTAPVIHSKLPGQGKIYSSSNPYTQQTAQDLQTVLQSGSLGAKPEELSSFVLGPGLGEEAVRRGMWALGVSTLLVVITMVLYYRGAGWVANLAVVLNLVMTLGILMFLGAALTLPGIAGLVLTLGMAVDANILVNERIREEKAAGKSLAQAITAGYDRAWITILDSNLTTILAGLVLFWVGTGPIRGFALTLMLGLAISMFTACYVTRTIFAWGLEKGVLTEFRMAPVMALPAFRYTSARSTTIGLSAVLIVLGTAFFALRGRHEKYDLEFTGGQRVVLSFGETVSIAEVKSALEGAGLAETGVRTIRGRGSDSEHLDLATGSDSFEITGRTEDEESGRAFEAGVRKALGKHLLPEGIVWREPGPKDDKGLVPVSAVLHVTTPGATVEAVREALQASELLKGASDLKVEPGEPVKGAAAFVLSAKVTPPGSADLEATLRKEVRKSVGANPALEISEPVAQSDFIGPGVANRLREQAILAVILSTLAQIVYLRFRFRDFTYGFAAAIIVAHNVLITLGFVAAADAFGIAHVKINLPVIASFLTLIGYSVNDTIVVFDRIRENLGRRIHPDSALIDRSISDTLARSIRTSVTVFLVAIALFAFNWGGTSSIEGFSFVMVTGVFTSAYASVFISSPLLLFLPVYSRSLKALGQPVVLGLIAALFAGLGIAATQQGAGAVAGGVLASLLPLHFLYYLALWLRQPDPDALLLQLEEQEASAAMA